jgi:CAAX prenyl protease-like protein
MNNRPWLPYVLPMGVYMAFLAVQTNDNLLWMYPLKTLVVAGTLWWFRKEYDELRCSRGSMSRDAGAPRRGAATTLGIVIGLVAIAIWIWGDPYYPKFDQLLLSFERWLSGVMNSPPPKETLTPAFDPTGRTVFIGFRIIGAVVVVPVMEELFWRAFAIRWLINEDFKSVALGTFTRSSFWITVGLFGAEHNQWLAGLICGALYNWLYYRTKSVWPCVVAHATSNAALAAYVLATGNWRFW